MNTIKEWIFSKLCLGRIPDPTIDSFPCAYCKWYKNEKCKLCSILKVED
jgi:hypothetical protein